jgi:hypothetical protein
MDDLQEQNKRGSHSKEYGAIVYQNSYFIYSFSSGDI